MKCNIQLILLGRCLLLGLIASLFAGGENITSSDPAECLEAVDNVSDQAMLVKIAREDSDSHVRQAAACKLTDETLLDLTDHATLLKVIGDLTGVEFRGGTYPGNPLYISSAAWAAVRVRLFLTDPVIQGELGATTLRVTLDTTSQDYGMAGMGGFGASMGTMTGERITFSVSGGNLRTEKTKTWNTEFPQKTDSYHFVPANVDLSGLIATLLTGFPQTKLAQIAMENTDVVVREAAIEKVEDPKVLAKAAADDTSSDVRKAAQGRLEELRKAGAQ